MKIKILVSIIIGFISFLLIKNFLKVNTNYRKEETGFAIFKPSDFSYYLPLPNTGKAAIYSQSIREVDDKKYLCVVIDKRKRGEGFNGNSLYEFSSKLEEVEIGDTYQQANASFTELKNFDAQKSVIAFLEKGNKTLYDFNCE
jgi:hypothetical protein